MTSDSWQRLEALFTEALEHPPDERDAFAVSACGEDAELLAELRRLVATESADGQEDLLEQVVAGAASSALEDHVASAAGRTIGPYRLLRELGAGGMGTVYLAERADEEFDQEVAIKLLRGATNPELRARFRAERQILATLEHPNIARLLDGGATEDGTPYVVMERVRGQPIDAYCQEQRLTTEERLEVFCKVCAAVEHAHRSLVVHRDIKPSNILVDNAGVPKLLDFGIAKLLDASVMAQPAPETRTGSSLLTPQYASPEQIRGEPITTAADVYSLGVLLYELLTSKPPYRVSTRDPLELVRAVCEQEPAAPSAAIESESSDPDLARQLAGDLDNIVLMALRKEPAQRYGSAGALADDLRRHLDRLPVIARPATWRYRISKFASRNRWGVAAATATGVALITAGIFSFVQMRAAVAASEVADRERSVALIQAKRAILSAASARIDAQDPLAAHRLLLSVGEAERGWAWQYLENQMDRSIAIVATDDALAAGWVEGPHDVVTVSQAGIVTWHSTADSTKRTTQVPTESIRLAKFSLDGTRLALAHGPDAQQVSLWELSAGELPQLVFEHHLGSVVTGLALSRSGTDILATSTDATWSWRDDSIEPRRWSYGAPSGGAALSPDGRVASLVSERNGGSYRLLDPEMPVLADTLLGRDVISVALSSDGTISAAAEIDRVVRLRDAATGRVLTRWIGHTVTPDVMTFSPGSRLLASAAPGEAVRIWDTQQNIEVGVLIGPDEVTELHFDDDGARLLALSNTGQAWVWRMGAELIEDPAPSYTGSLIAYPAATQHPLVLTPVGELRTIDDASGEPFDLIDLALPDFTALAVSPYGRRFLTVRDGVARLRELATWTTGEVLETGTSETVAVAFAGTGDRFATLDANGQLMVWTSPAESPRAAATGVPTLGGDVVFTRDGSRLATAHDDSVRVWDTDASQLHAIARANAAGSAVSFSRDGAWLASGWSDGTIQVSDAITGAVHRVSVPHTARVTALAFSPDGARLVSGAADGTVWVSELETGSPLLDLRGHSRPILSLAFSPDGSRVTSADERGTLRVWDAKPHRERIRAAANLRRERERVRPRVSELLERTPDPAIVAQTLRADSTLVGLSRIAALQITLDSPLPESGVAHDPFDGYAFETDSRDSYVLIGAHESLRMTDAFTLEAWVQPLAVEGGQPHGGTVINKEGEYQIAIRDTGEIVWTLAGPDGWMPTVWMETRYRVPEGAWAHLALVRDGSTVRFHVNGRQVQAQSVPERMGDHAPAMDELRISGRQHTPLSFRGRIDDVRIWSVARSQEQIHGSMLRRLRGNESGLLAAWTFDEGAGRVTKDLTGRFPGTLVGGTWSRTSR